MTQAKNTYSTKRLDKDLEVLQKEVKKIAADAVRKVVSQVHIEDTGIVKNFDEVEEIPYNISGVAEGTLMISVNTDNPIELEALMSDIAARSLDALEQEITTNMKGVL